MNIMDYRAIKAEEASQKADQTQTVTQTQTTTPAPVVETKPEVKPETKPEVNLDELKVVIDGVEVPISELKSGYLRQSDYTKKTQDVAKVRKETEDAIRLYETLKQNPQMIQQIKQVTPVPDALDPSTAKVVELEAKVYDMMLQNEISQLQHKYSDFEVREVLETAQNKNITNLEDAYLLNKSTKASSTPVDAEALKQQIRAELLKELEAERTGTQTLITSKQVTPVVTDNSPKLSEAEKKVARNMRLSEADYVKWRDVGRK